MTDERKSQDADEQVEDLDVGREEGEDVMGGKGGKGPKPGQEYLVVKLEDVQISSFQSGGSEGGTT